MTKNGGFLIMEAFLTFSPVFEEPGEFIMYLLKGENSLIHMKLIKKANYLAYVYLFYIVT